MIKPDCNHQNSVMTRWFRRCHECLPSRRERCIRRLNVDPAGARPQSSTRHTAPGTPRTASYDVELACEFGEICYVDARRFGRAAGAGAQMMARTIVVGLLLAFVLLIRSDTVVVIPSDTVVEQKVVDLPSIVSPAPFRIDDTGNERRSDIVVETKAERPLSVPQTLPFIVYYAYTEVPLFPKPIDVVADSIATLPLGSCRDEVKRAADVFALSFPVMMAFALIESSCQPRQKTGSYIGLFQLSQYEFNRYGRTGGDVYNPRDNAMAAAHKFVVEAIDFQHAVGRYPTPFDRYCIHQQGLEGCIQHQAQPDRIAWNSMCATQEGRTKGEKWCRLAIWGNVPSNLKASIAGGVAALTSGAFLDIWRGRVAHFTKLMTGIREAHAETALVSETPRVTATSAQKKATSAQKKKKLKKKSKKKRR
jgi:hypothetical protein